MSNEYDNNNKQIYQTRLYLCYYKIIPFFLNVLLISPFNGNYNSPLIASLAVFSTVFTC